MSDFFHIIYGQKNIDLWEKWGKWRGRKKINKKKEDKEEERRNKEEDNERDCLFIPLFFTSY